MKKRKLNKEELKGNRIPRPLGITLRLQSLNKENNLTNREEELRRIKIGVIEQWSSNNMKINERIYTIEQLALYLNIDEQSIMKYMWKSMGKMGKILGKRNIGEIAREIFGISLKKILESDALMADQLQILLTSQDGQYKPFISTAVNQAIGNLNTGRASFLALLKVLTDKQPTNIILNPIQESGTQQYLTTEGAMQLLLSPLKNRLDFEPNVDDLAAEFSQSLSLPDTNPRTQDVHFLNTPKVRKDAVSPNPITLNPTKSLTHEDRREIKESVYEDIEDSDDFIA